jgi:hypothetical protein
MERVNLLRSQVVVRRTCEVVATIVVPSAVTNPRVDFFVAYYDGTGDSVSDKCFRPTSADKSTQPSAQPPVMLGENLTLTLSSVPEKEETHRNAYKGHKDCRPKLHGIPRKC